MKVLLTSFGTDGDNAPFFALARALRDRGDEPILLLNPWYQDRAERLGVRFIALGERFHIDEVENKQKYIHPLKGSLAVMQDFYVPRVVPTYEAVRELIERERPDALVSHVLSFGASWAAQAAGVPYALATLSPAMWASLESPSLYAAFAPPVWMRGPFIHALRAVTNAMLRNLLRKPAAELRVAPRRDWFFAHYREARLNLALWSRDFRPAFVSDPPRNVVCGFPELSEGPPTPLEPALQAFLEAGSPPVMVGLGSSARDLGGAVYAAVAEACEELRERCLLIGPPQRAGLPASAFVVRAAPYHVVFPQARAIVHHGGVNTTAEAMRAGVPAVVVPFMVDQFDNAERAQRTGGARMLIRGRATRQGLVQALRASLQPERLARAKVIAADLRAEGDGAVTAARRIAELGRSGGPHPR